MSGTVTTRAIGTRPVPPPLNVAMQIDSLAASVRSDGYTAVAIPAPQRAVLTGRREVVAAALATRNDTETAHVVSTLLHGFDNGRTDATAAARRVAVYVAALRDVPPWAVADAALAWSRGQVPEQNKAFAPSPAQLYAAAEQAMKPYIEENGKLSRILTAKLEKHVDAEERERISSRMGALAAELKGDQDARRSDERGRVTASMGAASDRILRRDLERAGLPPDSMASPTLLARLGQSKTDRDE